MNEVINNRKAFKRLSCNNGFYDYAEFKLSNFHNEILSTDKKDIGFWPNQLIDGIKNTHTLESFDVPCVTWIDIDFKNQDQKDEFKRDIKDFKKFYNELTNDPYVYIFGFSLGGGIRIMGIVDSFYKECFDGEEQDNIYIFINHYFTDYICEKYSLVKNAKYMDTCAKRISQPTFALQKKNFYVNTNCKNFYIDYDIHKKLGEKYGVKQKHVQNNIDIIQTSEKNKKFLFSCLDNVDSTKRLAPYLEHYDEKIIAIARFSSEIERKAWFILYKKYYRGKEFNKYLYSFESFSNFLDNCEQLNYCINLERMLFKDEMLLAQCEIFIK